MGCLAVHLVKIKSGIDKILLDVAIENGFTTLKLFEFNPVNAHILL